MESICETHIRCRLCRASTVSVLARLPFLHETLILYECATCAALFHLQDHLTTAAYQNDYHAYHPFQWLSPKTTLLAKKTFYFLRKHPHAPSDVFCDVGCGAGHVLRTARALGYRVVGYDIPSPAVTAMQADGLDVLTDTADLLTQWRGRCTRVTCWHTLEHVSDPHAFLDMLTELLAPGGWLSLEVPESKLIRARARHQSLEALRQLAKMPEHITLCSRGWLAAELEKRGLAVEKVFTPADGAFYALAHRAGYWRRKAGTGNRTGNPAPQEMHPAKDSRWSFTMALAGVAALCLEPLAPFLAPRSSVQIWARKA